MQPTDPSDPIRNKNGPQDEAEPRPDVTRAWKGLGRGPDGAGGTLKREATCDSAPARAQRRARGTGRSGSDPGSDPSKRRDPQSSRSQSSVADWALPPAPSGPRPRPFCAEITSSFGSASSCGPFLFPDRTRRRRMGWPIALAFTGSKSGPTPSATVSRTQRVGQDCRGAVLRAGARITSHNRRNQDIVKRLDRRPESR